MSAFPARRSGEANPSYSDRYTSLPSRSSRTSRVRFGNDDSQRPSNGRIEEHYLPASSPRSPPTNGVRRSAPQWELPLYDNQNNIYSRPERSSDPEQYTYAQQNYSRSIPQPQDDSARRRSNDSDSTLHGDSPNEKTRGSKDDRFSLSSYNHPYDINPPPSAYSGRPSHEDDARPRARRSVSFAPTETSIGGETEAESCMDETSDDPIHRRRGVLSNLIDLYSLSRRKSDFDGKSDASGMSRAASTSSELSVAPGGRLRRRGSMQSDTSEVLDADDPRVTGITKKYLDDPEDVEKACKKQMDYKARKKERMKMRIEFNVSSMLARQDFLMTLARALLTFGAPSHRIESQLIAASRILEVDAEFIHIPGVIICSFGDIETKTSESHFVKCGGRIDLGRLQCVHQIYRSVVHDELSAKKAKKKLEALLTAKPIYKTFTRCILAFCLSALICPLAFGGSFLDMWIAAAGAFVLCALQLTVAAKSVMYAQIFEISVAILMSFVARGLSSIRSQVFCYSAISSAGIVGILPGYLILSSSLELASKNIICGSVKMVYALIYTLSLGFGLQIGSDFYLLLDPGARHSLQYLAANMSTTISLVGNFTADNGISYPGLPLSGTFTFSNSSGPLSHDLIAGCYRAPDSPWYLQPFPWWTQFIIVPIFSVISSLANLQPFWSSELIVMTLISCASYAANKVANHFIFGRSDIVSAIGAFTVGLLGNIYSRKMGGTAFTSMVTGVLFLVPSGLSQAGGITADGSGIDIGGAMISVTIGVTVGLFMSQALVYTFGTRKNAAVFSF